MHLTSTRFSGAADRNERTHPEKVKDRTDHLDRLAQGELAREFYPNVPVTGDLSGNNAFFSSRKAERLLGWKHDEATS